jgi:TatA/E family protein of Tat protein translocase
MFGSIGGPELLLVLVLALIVFGPRKLPEIGKSLGRMMAEFRKASTEFRRTIEDEVELEKRREDAARLAPPSASTPTGPASGGAAPASADLDGVITSDTSAGEPGTTAPGGEAVAREAAAPRQTAPEPEPIQPK